MVILFWALTVIFTAVDMITKALAEKNIGEGDYIRVITAGDTDILAFSMHRNTGAAFSSFTGKTAMLAAVTAAALVAMTVYFHLQKGKRPFMTVSYAMIVGGGIGNLIDRVFQGYVTDFIHLFPFSFIFNFADICVVIGAIMLAFCALFMDEAQRKKTAEDGNEQ